MVRYLTGMHACLISGVWLVCDLQNPDDEVRIYFAILPIFDSVWGKTYSRFAYSIECTATSL